MQSQDLSCRCKPNGLIGCLFTITAALSASVATNHFKVWNICLFTRRSAEVRIILIVYIRGKWLNRGYMYIVKISSLVLYMCIYISKKYLVHIAEFETGVLWQNRCIAIDTARNPSKKTYEQLFEAKSRKVNCKGMENTDWIFPSLSYSLFYCFKSNKKSL